MTVLAPSHPDVHVPRTGGAAAAVVAAAGFVAYPVLRPYSSEVGLAGARAFAADRWVAAHTIGMFAFLALAAATAGLAVSPTARRAMAAGVALVLPYYGAESFGLHAIGVTAVTRHDGSLTTMSDTVRNNPVALTLFGAGLVLIAVAGVLLSVELWLPGHRVTAVLLTLGTVGYPPQFFLSPPARIGHGIVLAVALALLATRTRRHAG